MADSGRGATAPDGYRTGYDAAWTAVENYPLRAIRMQLERMAGTAVTEAQWGAVDALSDLVRQRTTRPC